MAGGVRSDRRSGNLSLVSNLQAFQKLKCQGTRCSDEFHLSDLDIRPILTGKIRVLKTNSALICFLKECRLPWSEEPSRHIFWYTLNGRGYDLGELRALQDWYVKSHFSQSRCKRSGFIRRLPETISDFRRSNKLTYYNITLADVLDATRRIIMM